MYCLRLTNGQYLVDATLLRLWLRVRTPLPLRVKTVMRRVPSPLLLGERRTARRGLLDCLGDTGRRGGGGEGEELVEEEEAAVIGFFCFLAKVDANM